MTTSLRSWSLASGLGSAIPAENTLIILISTPADHPLQWHCVLCRDTGQQRTHEHHSSPPHFHPDSKWEQKKAWFRKKNKKQPIHIRSVIFRSHIAHLYLQSTFQRKDWTFNTMSLCQKVKIIIA
uniref:Secreted protein n=1 Tax=Seriola dumerili TaxID=41447 RepID=A0A3B4UJJ1_SERDU